MWDEEAWGEASGCMVERGGKGGEEGKDEKMKGEKEEKEGREMEVGMRKWGWGMGKK
jgi:hypothetical protein